jgi:hypothetical protein
MFFSLSTYGKKSFSASGMMLSDTWNSRVQSNRRKNGAFICRGILYSKTGSPLRLAIQKGNHAE